MSHAQGGESLHNKPASMLLITNQIIPSMLCMLFVFGLLVSKAVLCGTRAAQLLQLLQKLDMPLVRGHLMAAHKLCYLA